MRRPAPSHDGSITVIPDGRHVYATSESVAIFDRDRRSGALRQLRGRAGCISAVPAWRRKCRTARALNAPAGVAVSPDGRNDYIADFRGDAILSFERDPRSGASSRCRSAGSIEPPRSDPAHQETPDTAIPLEIRATRNLGKARKEFLTLVAENAACLANAQGGVIVLGVRDAAPARVDAIQGVPPAYSPEAVRLPDVVRELVANAFAHRDWEQPGMIDIAHSPDGLVVASPGDILATLHPDRLLRESAQRNRVLSREIARLRIAEGAGMGFDRVYRSLAAAGKQPPRIEVGPRFTVVVSGGQGDRVFARFLRSEECDIPTARNRLTRLRKRGYITMDPDGPKVAGCRPRVLIRARKPRSASPSSEPYRTLTRQRVRLRSENAAEGWTA